MSSVFSGLGKIFTGGSGGGSSKILPGILTGAGFLSNWLNGRKQNSYIQQQIDLQKQMTDLMNNPTELARRAGEFEKPLSAGLTEGVGNQVQAYLGERGLGTSPAIAAQVMSQAMAPYKQQNQQTAIQELFNSLKLPFQNMLPLNFTSQTDLSGLLKMLMAKKGGGGLFGGGAAPGSSAPQSPDLGGWGPLIGDAGGSGGGNGDGWDFSGFFGDGDGGGLEDIFSSMPANYN